MWVVWRRVWGDLADDTAACPPHRPRVHSVRKQPTRNNKHQTMKSQNETRSKKHQTRDTEHQTINTLQGYLAHKKTPSSKTMQ